MCTCTHSSKFSLEVAVNSKASTETNCSVAWNALDSTKRSTPPFDGPESMVSSPTLATLSLRGRRQYVLVEMGLGQWLLVGAEVIHYFLYYTVKGGTWRDHPKPGPKHIGASVWDTFGIFWVWNWMNMGQFIASDQWEIFRTLKWRYVSSIFWAVCCGDIPLHRPCRWKVPPIFIRLDV